MKALGAASLVVALVACGPAAVPPDNAAVVVPWQPPPPIATAAPLPVAAPPAAPVAFRCDTGKRFEVASRSYCAYADPSSWKESERRCVANGGHLMTLATATTSKAIHAALGSPVSGGRAAWMGLELKKNKGKSEWKWISGDALTDTSWSTGEPNNFDNHEECAEWLVADGRWNDTRCDLEQPYLCQSKGEKPLTCSSGRTFSAGATRYCLNDADRPFADAKRRCTADGGALAVLKTTQENRAVQELMAARIPATRMWIGLKKGRLDANDPLEEGTWRWVSNAPVELEAWEPNEPNNYNGEDCAEVHAASWQWNDLDCNVKLPSVCESPTARP